MRNMLIDSSQVIIRGKGFVTDILLSASASGAYVKLYDGANATGKLIVQMYVGDNLSISVSPRTFIQFDTGLYCTISGTNATANIGYRV